MGVIGLTPYHLPSWLQRSIRVSADPRTHGKLKSEANFVRFLFPQLLLNVNRLLYLDVDVLIQEDVKAVYSTLLNTGVILAAVQRPIPLRRFLAPHVIGVFQSRYGYAINLDEPSFNAGVLLMNLEEWRASNATRELRFWMEEHRKTPLWELGTQPPILLISYKRWAVLDSKWNLDGVGYRSDITSLDVSQAAILHWTGSKKPWDNATMWSELWRTYHAG
jgi:alpha-1,4-galacturonosyltransferase